jgi:hypothetical protein
MKKINIFIIYLIILLFFIFIYNFYFIKESFTNYNYNQWSPLIVDNFLSFQSTVNPQSHFDMNIIQQQATEKEAIYLLQNGFWPWSQETEYMYMDAIANESIIRLTPGFSLQTAKQIYNENAIRQMLSWNTKEGQFLLYGGKSKEGGQIKCFSNVDSPSVIKKIQLHGYDLWNGYKNETITNVDNKDISSEMPGFSFIHEPCNPCIALDNNYSCPFKINIKGDESVTEIWKYLWKL